MTGPLIAGPPVKHAWVYLLVATLTVLAVVLGEPEYRLLLTHPTGVGAVVAILAGFWASRSMALTPWALVSGSLVLYGLEQGGVSGRQIWAVGQVILLAGAAAVALFQLKVVLVSGVAASIPARTRWGSVLVTATMCLVVIFLARPDVVLMTWTRNEAPAPLAFPDGTDGAPLERLGRLQDPTLVESSGLVASGRHEGVLWTHNDSGNPPALYCVRTDGRSCGTWTVTGAVNNDWEGIAWGRSVDGTSQIYIGDIGDNDVNRRSITVYRFDEPQPSASGTRGTVGPEMLEFTYPDGPHDAETLLVHPVSGDLYVVTKEMTSGVYRASAPFDTSHRIPLAKVGSFSLFANFADRTGGDISADGRRVVLATYGGWYELTLPRSSNDFEDIWHATPRPVAVRAGEQWESVAYQRDGRAIYVSSEGRHRSLYRVGLPPAGPSD